MHPSKDILGSRGDALKGYKIILCITGGIASYKCPDLARELMRYGAEVYTFMTEASLKFIKPELMEWATGNPVVYELSGDVEHIALAGEGGDKLVLVSPATANTISKVAHGICDNALTTVIASALGSGIPVVFVPSMHSSLYMNPAFQRSLSLLKEIGAKVVEPRWEEGKAKMPTIDEIVSYVLKLIKDRSLFKGLKFLITAGPTREPLDAVRYLTNASSGRMGFALANEVLKRGGGVALIKGPTWLKWSHPKARVVEVVTTKEMYDAVERELKEGLHDVVILAAAPLDYGFSNHHPYKIPSGSPMLDVKLEPRPKISMNVRKLAPKAFFVGFKAEYGVSNEVLVERAYKRLKEADMDLIVANDLSREGCGFEHETNEVLIIDRGRKVVHIPLSLKSKVAEAILDVVSKHLGLK